MASESASERRGVLVVTGASGFLGSTLLSAATEAGWSVEAWSRGRPRGPHDVHRSYLLEELPQDLPPDCRAVVHLAADTQRSGLGPEVEVAAAQRLAELCARSGARMLFVSSRAVSSPSTYGEVKRSIEAVVLSQGAMVLRVGLVTSFPPRSGLAALERVARGMPVGLRPKPDPLLTLTSRQQVSTEILGCLERPDRGEIVDVSGLDAPLSMVLSVLAEPVGPRLHLPVPTKWVLMWLLRLPSRWRNGLVDRAISLFGLPSGTSVAVAADHELRRLLVMRRDRANRDRLTSARTLLRYVLGGVPSWGLVRRFVRAAQAHGLEAHGPEALRLVRWCPRLLSLWDQPGQRGSGSPVTGRMMLAFRVAEASVEGADLFLLPSRRSLARTLLALLLVVAGEALMWPLRTLFRWFGARA